MERATRWTVVYVPSGMRKTLLRTLALVWVLGACGDVDPADRPVEWDYILPAIVEPSCATSGCHSELAEAADLVLEGDARAVRSVLVTRGFVLTGHHEGSALMNFLRGRFGVVRMPP